MKFCKTFSTRWYNRVAMASGGRVRRQHIAPRCIECSPPSSPHPPRLASDNPLFCFWSLVSLNFIEIFIDKEFWKWRKIIIWIGVRTIYITDRTSNVLFIIFVIIIIIIYILFINHFQHTQYKFKVGAL